MRESVLRRTDAPSARPSRPALRGVARGKCEAARCYLAWRFPFVSADRWRCTRPPWDEGEGALVLVEQVRGRAYVAGTDALAALAGVVDGMGLAAARTAVPGLIERPHRPRADLAWLEALADGARRWARQVAIEPPHGLVLDVTEVDAQGLTSAMAARFAGLGVIARSAQAATPEAALALARFEVGAAVSEVAALRRLPLRAIDLDEAEMTDRGIATLGDLLVRPRAGLAALIGRRAVLALDRLFGAEPTGLRFGEDVPVASADLALDRPPRAKDLQTLAEAALAGFAPGDGALAATLWAFAPDGLAARQRVPLPAATRDPLLLARAARLPRGAVEHLRLVIDAVQPMALATLF